MPVEEARSQGLVTGVGMDVDAAYLGAVRGLSTTSSRSANVVFSPIHGAGSTNVLPVLRGEGFDVTTVPEGVDVEALSEALEKLGQLDARGTKVVKLRYFAGLSIDKTAEVLGISPRTVQNEWMMSKTWLKDYLRRGEPAAEVPPQEI